MRFSKQQIRIICIAIAATLLLTIGASVISMFTSVM